jgi:peptidoglycan hydrolase CwlO-like protein
VQETQLDKLSKQIDSTTSQLQETRKQYDAKIKNISNYTDTQLERFFAARYR